MSQDGRERTLLILTPTGRDAQLVTDVLARAKLPSEVMLDASSLCAKVDEGTGAILLAEEALSPSALNVLSATLAKQASWSDLPIIIFAVPTDSTTANARQQRMLDALGNVTIMERPFRAATLVTVVRSALRARDRQSMARRTLLDLEQQEIALKRADQRKDEFLAMLAHELRNPLAAIGMALSMLERSAGDAAKTARFQETARRQMGNLVRLVDDLLDVSRITRGIVELKKEPLDLATLLQQSLVAARPTLEARNHELTTRVSPGPFPVLVDATRVEQIISNLLSNAAKYTDPGGKVQISLTRETVHGTEVAVLSVRDTGRGIPDAMLDKVFELFVQVDQSLDRTLGGLGLGLTLVKQLVQMHGGEVEAKSPGLNQGSEFTVRLPLAPTVGESTNRVAHDLPSSGAPCRIVLVEDAEDLREGMKELLEQLGHEVAVAADGLEGVSLFLRETADIGLVDVGLPGIDGYEVARRVRAAARIPRIFLIAITGYGGPEARRLAAEAGFDLHLTKPINFTDLPNLLSRAHRHEAHL
jgi:signal transduction histidine kinase/ActR/RegA family two-component response regulator